MNLKIILNHPLTYLFLLILINIYNFTNLK